MSNHHVRASLICLREQRVKVTNGVISVTQFNVRARPNSGEATWRRIAFAFTGPVVRAHSV
jgi:hypothetical protein